MQGFANQAHICNHCMILSLGRYFCPTSQHIPILLQYICTQLTIHTHLVTVSESQGMTKCRRVVEGGAGGGSCPPTFESMPPDPPSQLAPTPLKCYVLAANHVVRFTRPSDSVFAYCKQSKTGAGEGLGTRLVCISRSRGSRPA